MENFLNTLEIFNFKSVKQLYLEPKRVNLFIGEPNVGKSNILEAISLLGAIYSKSKEKFLREFIRYEHILDLHRDCDIHNRVTIKTNKYNAHLDYDYSSCLLVGHDDFIKTKLAIDYYDLHELSDDGNFQFFIEESGKVHDYRYNHLIPIKKYTYAPRAPISEDFSDFLLPPYGHNLFTIVSHNKELKEDITAFLKRYDLDFSIDEKNRRFQIHKKIDESISKYSYSNISDAFKRFVFYSAAIDSNKDSVLIFDEPEGHCFPPHIKELSDRIIASEENQFFISTHSPYLLQNMISNLGAEELNVHITYYEDHQTKAKLLSSDQLGKASDLSMDVFFNLSNFIK